MPRLVSGLAEDPVDNRLLRAFRGRDAGRVRTDVVFAVELALLVGERAAAGRHAGHAGSPGGFAGRLRRRLSLRCGSRCRGRGERPRRGSAGASAARAGCGPGLELGRAGSATGAERELGMGERRPVLPPLVWAATGDRLPRSAGWPAGRALPPPGPAWRTGWGANCRRFHATSRRSPGAAGIAGLLAKPWSGQPARIAAMRRGRARMLQPPCRSRRG